MADEAFALSPISARAALPSEEDYAAISEAFMETARGRWFLTEYAKRNRNADTRMVLDAVARIEQSLAAQKEDSLQQQESHHEEEALTAQQQAAEAAAAATAAKNSLTEALGAIRDAVEATQEFGIRGARQPRAGAAAGTGPQGRAGAARDRLALAGNRQ